MAVAYPFSDSRFTSSQSPLPEAVQAEIANAQTPIIEIGGPTERGYRQLAGAAILPSRPIITNVPGFFGTDPRNVDRLVDGKAMPFDNSSVGMFLASHISPTDFFERDTIALREPVASQETWNQLADEEYDIYLSDRTHIPKHNLRIGMLREMTRTLVGNGIILFEAIGPRDIEIAQALGHSVISQTAVVKRRWNTSISWMILRMPMLLPLI